MKKFGFTLAEVLITLVIIGVISAVTVPTLMNNTEGKEFSSKFKKAISASNEALSSHYALEGLTARDYTNKRELMQNLFKQRMNIMEDYEFSSTYKLKDEHGTELPPNAYVHFVTDDGIVYIISTWFVDEDDPLNGMCNTNSTHICAYDDYNLVIDVNGEKGPNKLTTNAKFPKDVYLAQMFNQKIVPYGLASQGVMYDKQDSEQQDPNIHLPSYHEEK